MSWPARCPLPCALTLATICATACAGEGAPRLLDGDAGESEGESGESGALLDLPETSEGEGDGDGEPGEGDGDEFYGPPLYDADRIHSPITPFVSDSLASIRALAPAAPGEVFMKVGASSTVSPSTLYCFAEGLVDLDLHEPALAPALGDHLLGQAGDTTPFNRDTLAAQSGKTAAWAIEGAPSPLDQERAAIHPEGPALALVHYGTNDMQQGITYASAMPGYYASMSDLLDLLIDAGIIPIVFGISRRLDSDAADLWVQSYNALARGLAQARSIPFIDLRLALEPLPGHGISGDGIHLEGYEGGPCIFSPEGLTHGYNVRNLIALESLARLHRVLTLAQPIADTPLHLQGLGELGHPLEIPSLPFADTNSTLTAPSLMLDVYSGCGALADESGPENIYRLQLSEPTPIRAMVLDRAGVDVDLHILDESGSEEGCIARDDRLIETTLDAGVYYFSLDTYVDGMGEEQSGTYTFVVLECEPGDTDCL